MKKKQYLTKGIAWLLCMLLMIPSVFADTGSVVRTTSMGASSSGYTFSNAIGCKLSIIYTPVETRTNGNLVYQYELGYMAQKTPVSARPGYDTITDFKGSHSIYIVPSSSNVSEEAIPTDTGNGMIMYDLGTTTVKGNGGNYTSDSELAAILNNTVLPVLRNANWEQGVSDMQGQLGIANVREMTGDAQEIALEKNKKIFRAIGSLFYSKYPNGVTNKLATDGVAISETKEYIILIEPLITCTIEGEKVYITPTNMARAYTLSDGKDVMKDKNWQTSWKNAKESSLYQTWRPGIKGLNNLFSVTLGSVTASSYTASNSPIVSKIYYNGPIDAKFDEMTGTYSNFKYATYTGADGYKHGYGMLRPADFLGTSPSQLAYYASIQLSDDTFGASGVNSPLAASIYSQVDLPKIINDNAETSSISTVLQTAKTLTSFLGGTTLTPDQIKNLNINSLINLCKIAYVDTPSYRAVADAIKAKGYEQSKLVGAYGVGTVAEAVYKKFPELPLNNPTVPELEGSGTKLKPTEVALGGSQ